jgi:hypothetical protein
MEGSHFLRVVVADVVLAVWTSILSTQPFLNAFWMKPVEAGQDQVLVLNFILAHANRAGFVLL